MGQKVHPIAFRLGLNQRHQSEWFQPAHIYSELIVEDQKIRQALLQKYTQKSMLKDPELKNFADPYILKIRIVRDIEKNVSLTIYALNHDVFFDKETRELTQLYKFVQKLTKFKVTSIILKPAANTIIDPKSQLNSISTSNAKLIAILIAEQIEKRQPFRRVMKLALSLIMKQGIAGAKIQVSGRLNGAEMARTEEVRGGRVPLHTLRAKIDYGTHEAHTLAGLIGIKVWIFNAN